MALGRGDLVARCILAVGIGDGGVFDSPVRGISAAKSGAACVEDARMGRVGPLV